MIRSGTDAGWSNLRWSGIQKSTKTRNVTVSAECHNFSHVPRIESIHQNQISIDRIPAEAFLELPSVTVTSHTAKAELLLYKNDECLALF